MKRKILKTSIKMQAIFLRPLSFYYSLGGVDIKVNLYVPFFFLLPKEAFWYIVTILEDEMGHLLGA